MQRLISREAGILRIILICKDDVLTIISCLSNCLFSDLVQEKTVFKCMNKIQFVDAIAKVLPNENIIISLVK